MMIVPGITTVERLCADALVAAERGIETRIVDRLDDDTKCKLDGLLSELVDDRITRFVWLRQFEVGANSADACRLLDCLELLQGLNLKPATGGFTDQVFAVASLLSYRFIPRIRDLPSPSLTA